MATMTADYRVPECVAATCRAARVCISSDQEIGQGQYRRQDQCGETSCETRAIPMFGQRADHHREGYPDDQKNHDLHVLPFTPNDALTRPRARGMSAARPRAWCAAREGARGCLT